MYGMAVRRPMNQTLAIRLVIAAIIAAVILYVGFEAYRSSTNTPPPVLGHDQG